MVGRLLGYLAICGPRAQTIGELADALLASRSAITGAVTSLEHIGVVQRSRTAGERMDRIAIDLTSARGLGFDVTEYLEQSALAHEGLELLAGEPAERRAVLVEWAALADWIVDRLPQWEQDWKAHRESLIEAGRLPDTSRSSAKEEQA
jgi:DNA-binding MarR family transcriptional regulator